MYYGNEFNKEIIITRVKERFCLRGKTTQSEEATEDIQNIEGDMELLSYKIPPILGLFYRTFSIYGTDCVIVIWFISFKTRSIF